MRRTQLATLAAHGIKMGRTVPEFDNEQDAIDFGATLCALRDCEADDGVGFKLRFSLPTAPLDLCKGVVHYGRYGWIVGIYRSTDHDESFDMDLASVYNDVLQPYDLANLLENIEIAVAAGLPMCAFFKLLDALVEGTLGHPLVTEKRNNDVQRCFIDLVDLIRPGMALLENIMQQPDPNPALEMLLGRLNFSNY